MKIAERLLEARTKMGISASEVARRLEEAPQHYANWESGKNVPRISTLIKIAKVLNVSVDWLIGEGESEQQESAIEPGEMKEIDTMGEDQRYTNSNIYELPDGKTVCTVKHCAWRHDGYCPGAGCMRDRERMK